MDATLIQTPSADPVERAVKAFRNDGQNNRYQTYREYLDGKHPLQFATPKYKSAFGNLLEALAYDRTNPVVDAMADRMQVTGFQAKTDSTQIAAQDLWDSNAMERREGEVEKEAFGMGDGYLIVETHPETGDVHIWPNDADKVRVFFGDEVPGEIEFAAKQWRLADGHMRLNIYKRGVIEKYISRTKIHVTTVTSAALFERYEPEGQSWTFELTVPDVVPVFHIANNGRTGRYGESELLHVIPMQDALNKTITDLLVAMEFGAFPQKVVMGLDDLPPEETPEGQASRKKLAAFELGIDRIMRITGASAKVAEFQAVALAQFISTAEFFDKTVSRISRVPIHYLTMAGEFQSGQSKRMSEAPFVAKIVDRQRAFGDVYGQAVQYGLRLQGKVDSEWITPIWQSAAPLSREDELDIAMRKQALGVPLEFVLQGISDYDESDVKRILELVQQSREEAERAFNRGLAAPMIDREDDAA